MYWSSKLKRAINLERKPRLPDRFSSESGPDEIRGILAENPVIRGDASIIDQFIENGDVVYYRRGQTLIQQGDQSSHVFFLLAGSVDIHFRSQLGSIREAPNQVGELAATKPGAARSATVTARTDEVAALRVSGGAFQRIYATNQNFRQRLEIEKDSRFRERIAAGQVAKENSSIAWFLTALASAAAVACITWFLTGPLHWTHTTQLLTTLAASILSFLVILLLNPVFFWRRCFWAAFVAMIGTHWFGRYVLIEVDEGLQITFGEHAEGMSSLDTTLQITSFLAVMLICAVRDHAVTRRA